MITLPGVNQPTRGVPVLDDGPLPPGEWWRSEQTQGRTLCGITTDCQWYEVPTASVINFRAEVSQ